MGDPKRQEGPHEKGDQPPLHRWKLLANNMDFVDYALDEKRDYATHIGGNVYATGKASGICVDIRHYNHQTEVVPTKKGITLRPSEYARLKDVASVNGDVVPELNSVVPCPYRSIHMNQFGFLSCSEYNPHHCRDWCIY